MLVFSLRRGESFYVGHQRVQLLDYSSDHATLTTQGASFRCEGIPMALPGEPRATVSVGARGENSIRIGIQAPLDIKVLRERLYLVDKKAKVKRSAEPRPRVYSQAASCLLCRGTMLLPIQDEGRTVMVRCPKSQNSTLAVCSSKM